MLQILQANSHVLGLVEFGSNPASSTFTAGDYDLLVILDQLEPNIRSIHFHIGQIAVDLNVRAITLLRRLDHLDGFDTVFVHGRIIYDPTGETAQQLDRLHQQGQHLQASTLSPDAIARIRHWHTHVLEKLRGRLTSNPTFCAFLLHTNVFWLIQNYFRIHELAYEGPSKALAYIERREPTIYSAIQEFYGCHDLQQQIALTRQLTAHILHPVGGAWQQDEVLACGEGSSRDLEAQGRALFDLLFSSSRNT